MSHSSLQGKALAHVRAGVAMVTPADWMKVNWFSWSGLASHNGWDSRNFQNFFTFFIHICFGSKFTDKSLGKEATFDRCVYFCLYLWLAKRIIKLLACLKINSIWGGCRRVGPYREALCKGRLALIRTLTGKPWSLVLHVALVMATQSSFHRSQNNNRSRRSVGVGSRVSRERWLINI